MAPADLMRIDEFIANVGLNATVELNATVKLNVTVELNVISRVVVKGRRPNNVKSRF